MTPEYRELQTQALGLFHSYQRMAKTDIDNEPLRSACISLFQDGIDVMSAAKTDADVSAAAHVIVGLFYDRVLKLTPRPEKLS